MDWNDIRLIAEIGRTGSFTGAAVALGVSKPTVSRRVAYLEQTARAKLFLRSPHGAALTPIGETLLRRATPISDAVLDFERVLRSVGRDARPMVTVRMTEGVASYLITPALTGQRIGPVGESASRTGVKLPIMKLLAPGDDEPAGISLTWTAYGSLPAARPTDRVRKLADIRFVPLYSGDYGKGRKEPGRFDDLADHRLITMQAYGWFSQDGWADWHRLLAETEAETIQVDWSSAIGYLIGSGAGVGLLPTYAPMYSDRVLPVDVASPPMYGALWMQCSEEAYKDRAVRDCFGTLGQLFRQADWMNDAA